MRKIVAATVMAAAVAVGAVGIAAEASAQDGLSSGVVKLPTTSFTSPSDTTTPVHQGLRPGQRATIVCWTEGQDLAGSNVWFRIGLSGELGYVHRGAIVPDGYVSHC